MTSAAAIEEQAGGFVATGRPKIDAAETLSELDDIERELLGKSSALNDMRQEIKNVAGDERAAAGKAVAAAKAALEEEVAKRRAVLAADARSASLVHDRIDLTTGGRGYRRGHLHPVTRVWREL
jgi:phenylalanyl-tRNA synthetase alpha chain